MNFSGLQEVEPLDQTMVPDHQPLPGDNVKGRLLQRVLPIIHSYLLYLKYQANYEEELELPMSFSELHEEWEWENRETGRREEYREVVVDLVHSRFGCLDDSQQAHLERLLKIPLPDLIPRLLKVDHFDDLLVSDHFPERGTMPPAKSTLRRWWEAPIVLASRPSKPVKPETDALIETDSEDETDFEWAPAVLMTWLTPLHERLEREAIDKGHLEGQLEVLVTLLETRLGPEGWRQAGRQEGRQEGRREVVETLLTSRFGPDETLLQRVDTLLQKPLAELPQLLQLSREELLAKLGLT